MVKHFEINLAIYNLFWQGFLKILTLRDNQFAISQLHMLRRSNIFDLRNWVLVVCADMRIQLSEEKIRKFYHQKLILRMSKRCNSKVIQFMSREELGTLCDEFYRLQEAQRRNIAAIK